MAKPMLVTLPFVLLLLDYWPLGRWTAPVPQYRSPEGKIIPPTESQPTPEAGFRQAVPPARRRRLGIAARLVLEKVPLLALTTCSCLVAIWAYGSEGVNLLDQRFALPWRIGNAPLSCVSYLGMFFYPVNLATPYPRPTLDLPLLKIVGAVVLLAVLTAAAIVGGRRRPYLLVGWLWYLGMLVPVSGILQFGMQTMADRFTYLPQIGLCIALVWFLADALKSWPPRRLVYSLAAALLLAVLMGCAWRQTSFWHDNVTLWNHTLACTSRNRMAHHALGNAFQDLGEFDKAIEQYRAAIAIEPDYVMSHYNLAVALAATGRLNEAIEHYRITVELDPDNALAHNNLGNALSMRGQLEEAMFHCQEALRIDPQFAEAHSNVADIWNYRGRVDKAIAEYQEALKLKPDFAQAHYPLGLIFAQRGRLDDAIAEYRKALEANPPFAALVHNDLGLALAARGRLDEAVEQYRSALAIKPGFIQAQHNLDRVLARSNRLD
jgi:tetratricopeptide (TPR) repeat protein